ncbi:MAG: sensor histidine kinase [Pseudomonadota bacterium]
MTATGSIGRRLTLLLAGVAALLSLLSWGMVSSLARQAAERAQDDVLAASVTTIAETLRPEAGEIRLELPYSAFSMLGAISDDRVFYRVSAGDRVLTGYPDLPHGGPDPIPAGRVLFETGAYLGDPVRIASLTRLVLADARPVPVTVTVAQTQDGVRAVSGDLSRLAAILSVAFFLIAVGLSFVAARASLRPLNEITQAVLRRGPSDLRPLRRAAPAELAPLVGALDRLMGRLGLSIRRSEEFIAEAAHRIRTPLATVRAQAEISLRAIEDEAGRQRLRRMIRAVDESSRSAGQLLDHATVAFRAEDLSRAPVDLADLARRAVEALEPTATLRDIDLRLEAGSATTVRGDAVLLDSALRNVLDNAIKYSPEDTTVTLQVHAADGQARIDVLDQGPGFDGAPAEHLLARFKRGANATGIVGSGLGLTIAADVLRAHGGRVELAQRSEGSGACVSLALPSA